jgi:hypothetical protein
MPVKKEEEELHNQQSGEKAAARELIRSVKKLRRNTIK